MHILFPQNPDMHKLPEPMFEAEYDAARRVGFTCLVFDEEALSSGEIDRALKRLPDVSETQLLYRGWILSEELYRRFHYAMQQRGYTLVSTPSQYSEVTYFPNYYAKIRDHSPAAVWTDTPDPLTAWTMSRKLGDGPFVIKDHIKSAKHMWQEACFIPKGSDRATFEFIAENLKKEQGATFHRGFVVKQYVPLQRRGTSAREYPQCEEYRLFFWRRHLLVASHYHRQPENPVDWSRFVDLAQRFDSPFFTMDVAQTESGDWIVIDMGAAEVCALPPSLAPESFYKRLAELSAEMP